MRSPHTRALLLATALLITPLCSNPASASTLANDNVNTADLKNPAAASPSPANSPTTRKAGSPEHEQPVEVREFPAPGAPQEVIITETSGTPGNSFAKNTVSLVSQVPEPTSLILLGAGLAVLGAKLKKSGDKSKD